MSYFLWGCRGISTLITLRSERVKPAEQAFFTLLYSSRAFSALKPRWRPGFQRVPTNTPALQATLRSAGHLALLTWLCMITTDHFLDCSSPLSPPVSMFCVSSPLMFSVTSAAGWVEGFPRIRPSCYVLPSDWPHRHARLVNEGTDHMPASSYLYFIVSVLSNWEFNFFSLLPFPTLLQVRGSCASAAGTAKQSVCYGRGVSIAEQVHSAGSSLNSSSRC